MRTRQPEKTKSAILQSAASILSEGGIAALTIDAVAKRTAISKGGVLHHFPNKNTLASAAYEYHFRQFEEVIERFRRQDPAMPGAYSRAFLRACIESYDTAGHGRPFFYQSREIPEFEQIVVQFKEDWMENIENDGLDHTRAHLVFYASNGIWLGGISGVKKPENFALVVQQLLDLCS